MDKAVATVRVRIATVVMVMEGSTLCSILMEVRWVAQGSVCVPELLHLAKTLMAVSSDAL